MNVSFIAQFLHDRYAMILHQDIDDKTTATISKGCKIVLVTPPVFHSHPLTR